jgi:hypothetical protein
VLLAASPVAAAVSDEQATAAIIQQSLANYPGPCPCPYNRMRNGRACGNVSAYVRPGGYSPICYARDVTPDMLRKFKASLGE